MPTSTNIVVSLCHITQKYTSYPCRRIVGHLSASYAEVMGTESLEHFYMSLSVSSGNMQGLGITLCKFFKILQNIY